MKETPYLNNLTAIPAVIDLAEKLGFALAHTDLWYSGFHTITFAQPLENGDKIKLTVSVERERKTSN